MFPEFHPSTSRCLWLVLSCSSFLSSPSANLPSFSCSLYSLWGYYLLCSGFLFRVFCFHSVFRHFFPLCCYFVLKRHRAVFFVFVISFLYFICSAVWRTVFLFLTLHLLLMSRFDDIFHKIHNFKILFFTKFTFSKSHFSQNSHFQSPIFHKIHILQTSNSR